MFLRLLPFIIVILIVEWYAFQAIKTALNNKWLVGVYSLIVVLVLGNFFWQFFGYNRAEGWTHAISYAIGFFVALASLQIVLFSFLFLEDIVRLLNACIDFFSGKATCKCQTTNFQIPDNHNAGCAKSKSAQ